MKKIKQATLVKKLKELMKSDRVDVYVAADTLMSKYELIEGRWFDAIDTIYRESGIQPIIDLPLVEVQSSDFQPDPNPEYTSMRAGPANVVNFEEYKRKIA